MNKPHAHRPIQRRNQQVNRRHIKITILTYGPRARTGHLLFSNSRTAKTVYFLCDIILEMRCLSHITGVSTDLLLAVRPWGGFISHRITHRRNYDIEGIFCVMT